MSVVMVDLRWILTRKFDIKATLDAFNQKSAEEIIDELIELGFEFRDIESSEINLDDIEIGEGE